MDSLQKASVSFPKPDGHFSYGTAGFREKADLLPSTVFRCGVIAALRAIHTGAATGLMVTASHNPEADNGVKLADPSGGMLAMSWEAYANKIANVASDTGLCAMVKELIELEKIDLQQKGSVQVFLGRDTRQSSPGLAAAAAAGIAAVGVLMVDLQLVTTPQLHFLVRACNRGEPHDEEAYYASLVRGYLALTAADASAATPLLLDAANGVGGPKWAALAAALRQAGRSGLAGAEVRNNGDGQLNHHVGADFVQKEQKPPNSVAFPQDESRKCVSLDGDADRLVYYTPTATGLTLLDGDKIAALLAAYIAELLHCLPDGDALKRASVGVVQTAYANGASTAFLTGTLKLATEVTPTGVKHLHKAAENFDIGIYFEANGHGTVLFKDSFMDAVKAACAALPPNPTKGSAEAALVALRALGEVVNQAVGDALSGVLVVEAVLAHREWGLADWAALYTDLPSRQLKVKVADRSVIETMNAETQVKSPAALQPLIDQAVAGYESGRSFVRPSGTEDVVRVYAEATTQEKADELALTVARHVHRVAGGIGPEP